MKYWLSVTSFPLLGHVKHSHMSSDRHFNDFILSRISPYFKPLKPYLKALWTVLHPPREIKRCEATAQSIIDIFKLALRDEILINEAQSAKSTNSLGKRSLPGDLVSTGWDVVKFDKKLLTAEPETNFKQKRNTKLMNKRRRNV
jgi:hypothetical protein